MRKQPRSRGLLFGLFLSVLALLVPATADAGRMLVTGHDTDVHCNYGSTNDTGPHCHYIQKAVEYVRATAPDPTRKVLIIERSTGFRTALGSAFNGTPPAYDVVCPTNAQWAMTSLDTSTYSAMLVASAFTLGSSASQALNARKTDIEAFFNQGGGIFANTSVTVPTYYDFLPLEVGSASNRAPYSLTPAGQQIGLQDSTQGIGTYNDINCCATHNSFAEPAIGGPIVVAERDADQKPMTLIADGSIVGGEIVAPSTAPETALEDTPPVLAKTSTRQTSRSPPRPRGPPSSVASMMANGAHASPRTPRRSLARACTSSRSARSPAASPTPHPLRTPGRSTPSRPARPRSNPAPTSSPRRRRRRSRGPASRAATTPARSTGQHPSNARRPSNSKISPTGSTPSRSARSTRPATRVTRRRTRGGSTRSRRAPSTMFPQPFSRDRSR